MAEFVHYDLEIVIPEFVSDLTDLILALDSLRNKPLQGTTKPAIFFQLKRIFHILESVGSARIEGAIPSRKTCLIGEIGRHSSLRNYRREA